MTNNVDHIHLVCASCRSGESADKVPQALKHRLPREFVIRSVNCMAGCERPTTIGIQDRGKAQYLFGDISTDEDLDAIVEFAHQYLRSGDGWTNATDRPRALFSKTLSRLPRIELEEAL